MSGTASAGAKRSPRPCRRAPRRRGRRRPRRGRRACRRRRARRDRALGIGGQLGTGRGDDLDRRQAIGELERARQPRQHRPPGGAAGDDREPPVRRRLAHRRLGQAEHRQRERFAQREHAGVAEAADDDRVGPAVRVAVRVAGGERGVRRDHVARLAGDVGGAERRRDRLDLGRRADRRADAAREQLADRDGRVRVDDEQLAHVAAAARRRLRPARLARSQATLTSAIAITSSETPVVIVPRA